MLTMNLDHLPPEATKQQNNHRQDDHRAVNKSWESKLDQDVQYIEKFLESTKFEYTKESTQELEASLDALDKFGKLQKFPSVSRDIFNRLRNYLKTASHIQCLCKDQKPMHIQDYFYPNSVRRRVIQAFSEDSNSLVTTEEQWIQKKNIGNINNRVLPKLQFGLRIRVKDEVTIQPLPDQTGFLYLRYKKTEPYYNPKNAMMITLSSVWKAETEQACMQSIPIYEIEVEPKITEFIKLYPNKTKLQLRQLLAGCLLFQVLEIFAAFDGELSLQWI